MLDSFTNAYTKAIYFTDTGEGEQPASDAELSPEFEKTIQDDCRRFWDIYGKRISMLNPIDREWTIAEQAGHDFWLTRNGHGTGFWDRPTSFYGVDFADELTASVGWRTDFPEVCTFENDNGDIGSN